MEEQTRATSTARGHLEKGQRALAAQNLAEAQAQLELAVEADPKLDEAHFALGILELQRGEATAAIPHFRKVIELAPKSFQGHYHLALAYLRDQKLQEGAEELERAVAINPRHADAAYNLGVVLTELDRPKEALTYLRRASNLGPKRADVTFHLIQAELASGHSEEARREAEEGVKLFGADAAWQKTVGEALLHYGQPIEAISHLSEVLRLEPGPDIRRQLAAAHLEARDPGRVLALLQNATSAEDHYLLASAYLQMHRMTEADQESQLALTLEPQNPRYLLQRARMDQHLGKHLESLAVLEEVSQLNPKWPEPYYSAGVSYYLLHRYADARQSLDRALELDPSSVRALFLYSASLANEGRNREAEKVLSRAIARQPGNPRFQYHLGAIRLRDNREAEAQQAFEQAIRLKPDYAPPHYQLGKLFERAGQLKRATEELEIAVRYQPDLAQAFYHLGRIYNRLGEKEKSEKALSTFRQFKQAPTTEDREFIEGIQQELQRSER